MNLLLDTHVFIWWDSQSENLSPRALALCEDPSNAIHLSVASLWEIQIKAMLGKLALRLPLRDIVASQCEVNRLVVLDVEPEHVFGLDDLPPIHRDPFDRLLVAQARFLGLRLVSHDETVRSYPVDTDW